MPFARPRGLWKSGEKAGFLGSKGRSGDLKVAIAGNGCGEYDDGGL